MKLLLLAIVLLITISESRYNYEKSALYPDQTSYWFDSQILDHFIQIPVQTWNQRYTVYEKSYDKFLGPLILYIGGEGPADGISTSSSFPIYIAQQLNGIVITLEHRFYGESQPFGQTPDSYSLEHLKYLTHEQALADIAYFIKYLKNNNKFGITQKTPVITIGGSYPGALSAWFRYLYSHLTIGSIASSAVVNAIEDYQQFDNQIRMSVNEFDNQCSKSIQGLTAYAEDQLFNQDAATAQSFKEAFGAGQLDDYDFLYFYADIFALQVQYGGTTAMCGTQLQGTTQQMLVNIQAHAKTSLNPNDYDQKYLKDDISYGKSKNARQWTYQTCTYFGWFYTASFYEPMRSKLINLQYFENLCQYVYGQKYIPNVNVTNQMMGGTNLRVTNLVFNNGSQDPWKWASILRDRYPMKAYVTTCMNCAHCVDLKTPSENNAPEITETQENTMNNVNAWYAEYLETL